MVPPTPIERPIDGQHSNEWTEYHKNNQQTAKTIQNTRTTNVLQVSARRTLCQKLPTHRPTKAYRDEDGEDASPPQVNDVDRASKVQTGNQPPNEEDANPPENNDDS